MEKSLKFLIYIPPNFGEVASTVERRYFYHSLIGIIWFLKSRNRRLRVRILPSPQWHRKFLKTTLVYNYFPPLFYYWENQMSKLNSATLRLFSAIQVDSSGWDFQNWENQVLMHRTISYGYVLSNNIPHTDEVLCDIEDVFGLSNVQANSSFHKSWDTIKNTSIETLYIQQVMHYFSTYGYELITGEYNKDVVYIPNEVLEIPELDIDIPLTIIHGMDENEIFNAIMVLATSGMALSEQTITDILTIISYNDDWDVALFIDEIKNRELMTVLCAAYNIVPNSPENYLRYLIYALTGETLVIKNRNLINLLKASDASLLDSLIEKAPDNLASIFFRYKKLFLAMKKASSNKTFFNRLRKDADNLHVPLSKDYLNSVTEMINHGTLDMTELRDRLEAASVFRKVRLADALNFRLNPSSSIVYSIRNGRSFATPYPTKQSSYDKEWYAVALDAVLLSISDNFAEHVDGELVYIPKYMEYSLPSSEKNFIGNIPSGSSISVDGTMILGIHWTDMDGCRIDLDLSLVSLAGKIGWDGAYRERRRYGLPYRDDSRNVLFSGDRTAAPVPEGASELFRVSGVSGESETNHLLSVNYYNYRENIPVDTKVVIASGENTTRNSYMIDVSKSLSQATLSIDQRETTVGILSRNGKKNTFFFHKASISRRISAGLTDVSRMTIDFLAHKYTNPLYLSHVLELAGAEIIHERPEGEAEYIDLSPETIDKRVLLSLMGM